MLFWVRDVYLDHNATTPVADEVQKAMCHVLKKVYGNPSSLHTHGRTAKGMVERARESVAKLLGCSPARVLFTSGGTEGNNAVIKGVYAQAGKGHIITTRIEHESTLGACRQLEALGAEVTYLPAGRDGLVRMADVKAAIRPDTVLISIMHANNETGAIQPVLDIAQMARSAGIPFHTDAVQTYGKISTKVDEIGCDFLTLSSHKINGPKGAGAIYWRGDRPWVPLVYGGYQEQKQRAGTEGVHQIVGLGAAAELAGRRMAAVFAGQIKLREKFVAGLKKIVPDVRINEAPAGMQLPGTINVTFPGKEGLRILAGLDCYQVSVSIGSACTADSVEPSHVLLGMGLSQQDALSTIRISMGAATAERDLSYTLDVIDAVLKKDPAGFAYMDPQHLTEEKIRSQKTFLVDLRFPYERVLAPTIPGAREWSSIYFERFIKKIPRDKEVIMMCGTGVFSFQAGYKLANSGHPAVRVVYGGYAAWKALYPDMIERLKKSS